MFSSHPDVVWAIHDLHYATHPPDWPSLTHRLQLLSEIRVGTVIRKVEAEEDAAAAKAAERL